jgi:hypothetical protein
LVQYLSLFPDAGSHKQRRPIKLSWKISYNLLEFKAVMIFCAVHLCFALLIAQFWTAGPSWENFQIMASANFAISPVLRAISLNPCGPRTFISIGQISFCVLCAEILFKSDICHGWPFDSVSSRCRISWVFQLFSIHRFFRAVSEEIKQFMRRNLMKNSMI